MTSTSDDIASEVVLDSASGGGRMTVLRMLWRPSDPLAVEITLTAQPDHPALPQGQWVILRDFLRYGLEEATGDGAVRIRPDDRGDRVWLELTRERRPCCVAVALPVVRAFLDRTEEVVPSGAERSDVALDELVERLLRT